jgi:hypothetical protein
MAIAADVSEAEISLLQHHQQGLEDAVFAPAEALVLRATIEILEQETVTDETWCALIQAYSNQEVVELCQLIGFYRVSTIMVGVWQLQVEPTHQAYLEQFPVL